VVALLVRKDLGDGQQQPLAFVFLLVIEICQMIIHAFVVSYAFSLGRSS